MTEVVVEFEVAGTPKPQGSMITSATSNALWYPQKTKDHRNLLVGSFHDQWEYEPIDIPVRLDLTFHMPRPAWHFGTGRNAGTLKGTSPERHTQTPDLDKLVRLVGDAMVVAGVLKDDSLIDEINAKKVWMDTDGSVGSTNVRMVLAR